MVKVPWLAAYRLQTNSRKPKEKAQSIVRSTGLVQGGKSLTMTYFHTGIRTIIGAESFHCPVRDGKEWYQLAMVIRHNCCDEQLHTGSSPSNS